MRNTAVFMVRAVTGGLLFGHGAQKLFGWFGGGGPDGTGAMFESLGYPRGRDMARLAGATEAAAGLSLASGLLTPLGAAGTIGVMTNASVAAHGSAGLWNHNGGYEYPLVLSTIAASLALTGPGRLSADAALGRKLAGAWWGLGALALGTSSAMAVLSTRNTQSSDTTTTGSS